MLPGKTIFAIVGSASENSANEHLVRHLAARSQANFHWKIFKNLRALPPFSPEDSIHNPPEEIIAFRQEIEQADAVLFCTPEYIFSIPAGLKNALEWCVATNIFSAKKAGIITASASGQKGHEELQLILKTLGAELQHETMLLIPGIKGKIDPKGVVTDNDTVSNLEKFLAAFENAMGAK